VVAEKRENPRRASLEAFTAIVGKAKNAPPLGSSTLPSCWRVEASVVACTH
jgi:hypothetical protein